MRCGHRVLSQSQVALLLSPVLPPLYPHPCSPDRDIPWASKGGRKSVCYWVSNSETLRLDIKPRVLEQA